MATKYLFAWHAIKRHTRAHEAMLRLQPGRRRHILKVRVLAHVFGTLRARFAWSRDSRRRWTTTQSATN